MGTRLTKAETWDIVAGVGEAGAEVGAPLLEGPRISTPEAHDVSSPMGWTYQSSHLKATTIHVSFGSQKIEQ